MPPGGRDCGRGAQWGRREILHEEKGDPGNQERDERGQEKAVFKADEADDGAQARGADHHAQVDGGVIAPHGDGPGVPGGRFQRRGPPPR